MGLFDPNPNVINAIAQLFAQSKPLLGATQRNFNNFYGPLTTQPRDSGASARMGGNPSGTFSGRRTVPTQTQQAQPQQVDPLQLMWQSLIGQLQQPVAAPTGVDTADLMEQVKKAINPIYDARAQAARSQQQRGSEQISGMYQALADDYKKLAPEQQAQATQAQEQVENLYGQLRSNLTGDYSRISKEQGDLFKQLGIESALPDVLEEQQAPIQDALTAAAENQAQQSQRYMDQGNIDATYYREGSPNALMTGNEINTNLLAELTDYLNQVEGERSSGIQSAYLDQLGQAQSQLAQQQQSAQSETARRQQMLWEMLSGSLGGGKQQELTADSFLGGLPQDVSQGVGNAFTQLQRSPEAVFGKVEDPRNPVPGTFVETTPEWYMAQADEMLKQGAIDEATHQALQMYLQLYFQMGQ